MPKDSKWGVFGLCGFKRLGDLLGAEVVVWALAVGLGWVVLAYLAPWRHSFLRRGGL